MVHIAQESNTISSNVKVVVRVRPENQREQNCAGSCIVRVLDENVLVFDPKEEASPDFYHGKRRKGRDFTRRKNRDLKFAFDRVFDQHETNEDVFNNTTKSIIESVLNGYNCSVFAYGATGAGKTHTMLGNPNHPGVIFLTMMRLYEVIEQIRDEKTCDVAVSYLEVYNEKIKDLLQPSTGFLPVREDPQKGVVVAGLSLHKPKSAEELMHMLAFGNCNRTQHPTDANAESSRSHAVFQVFVRQKDRTANISTNVRVGKMSLIDLAGSERATVTTNRGARFREGANINRSLLALGNCINALADDKRKGHIPYRNSKLTRLLKDSLGGNCRTVMIAAVSPSTLSLEDTYNTLRYADRAKHIKANLKKNVMSIDVHVSRYAQICDELRAEVSQLKTKLRKYESGAGTCKSMVMCDQSDEVDDLLRKIRYVFSARVSIHKEIMDLECSQRDVEFRIYRKERTLARLDCVHLEKYTQNEIMNKVQRQITSAQSRRCTLVDKTGKLNERLDENGQWLERVKAEIAVACKGEQVPEIVDMALHAGHLEVELRDTRRQVKHLKKLVKAQDRDTQASESLLFNLLSLVKKQHLLLKGNNLATSDIVSEFDSIQSTVVDDREISWADQSFSVSGESTISRLTDLPVISCVATPKAPVGQKQRRSSKSQTPKTPSRKSFIAADNTMTPGKNSQNVKGQALCFSPSGSPLTSGTESSLSLACVSGSQSADSPEASHQITAKAGATPAPREMKPVDDGHESKAQVEKKAGGTRPEKQAEADAVRYLRVEKGNDSIKSSEAIDLVSNAYGKNLHVSHDSLTTSKDSREVPLSRDLGGLLRLEHGRSYSVEAPQAHLAICEANSVTSLPSLSQSPPIVVSSDSSLSQHSVDDTYVIPVEDDQLCAEVVPPVIIESTSVNSVISTLESPKVTATGTDVAETFTSYTEEGGSSGDGKQIHLRLCGGATVTKAKCDSGTNQATKVPRALTFDTPTVKKSFADVVKSPPNSSILLSAYNSLRAASPLATQLSQTPVGDTCRNDENRAVVKSGSKHRRAATGPDQHLYLRRLGREREGQGDHDDQCSASPLREVNIGNGTLQRMGLPSMQKGRMAARGTPKYMKMTASAAIKRRNNHVRSLSSKENAPCELMSNPRRQSVYQRGRGNGGTMDGRKTGPKFRSQSCRTLSERNKLTTSLLYPKGQSRFETRSLDNEHHVPRLQATRIKTSTPPTAQNTGPVEKRPTPVNTTQKNMTQEKIGDFTKLSDTTSRNQNVAKSLPCSTPTDITRRVKPPPGRVQPRPIMATPCVNSSGRPLTPVSANSMRSNAAKRFAAQRKVQNFPPPCKVPARAGNVTADAKPLAKPFAWPRRLATSALAKLKLTVSSVHS